MGTHNFVSRSLRGCAPPFPSPPPCPFKGLAPADLPGATTRTAACIPHNFTIAPCLDSFRFRRRPHVARPNLVQIRLNLARRRPSLGRIWPEACTRSTAQCPRVKIPIRTRHYTFGEHQAFHRITTTHTVELLRPKKLHFWCVPKFPCFPNSFQRNPAQQTNRQQTQGRPRNTRVREHTSCSFRKRSCSGQARHSSRNMCKSATLRAWNSPKSDRQIMWLWGGMLAGAFRDGLLLRATGAPKRPDVGGCHSQLQRRGGEDVAHIVGRRRIATKRTPRIGWGGGGEYRQAAVVGGLHAIHRARGLRVTDQAPRRLHGSARRARAARRPLHRVRTSRATGGC